MQRYPDYIPPEVEEVNKKLRQINNKKEEPFFTSVSKRNFHKSNITGDRSLAASSQDNLVTVLKPNQLRECGLAYINNGIIRTVVDRSVYFINPERTDFVIEPNAELTVGLDSEEVKKIEQQIKDDTLTGDDGEPLRLQELRQKLVRINKRVKLHQQTDKLLASCLVFGRAALRIVRFPTGKSDTGTWNIFGEPEALQHLSSSRIKNVIADTRTGVFKGIEYDDNKATASGPKKYKSTELIPAFNDDYSILDNSNYSGLSAVWPVLEAANVIEAIISEDLPEVTRQTHSKFGIMYGGTSKKSTLNKLKEELEASTWLVHNEPGLTAEVHDLGRDPNELKTLVDGLARYICTSMNLPLFLLFEDTANFATANQVMQTYKAGMLKRYRTWLQGMLEDYWYDPILADHLNIPLKDVISAPIKIKAIFQDINFETRLDVITADEKLQNMMVFTNVDTAEDIGRKDIANRLQVEQNEINKAVFMQRNQDIKEAQMANGEKVKVSEKDKTVSPPKAAE